MLSKPPAVSDPYSLSVDAAALHRALLEGVQDYAIYALDPAGHVLSWNAGAQRLKGYQASEIVGCHASRFYLPADVAAGTPESDLRTAAVDGRAEVEGWRVRKDGTPFWAHVVTSVLRDADGGLIGFAKVTRDLSERRRAEEALRESESRFRSAFDHAAIGMAITRADGRWLKVNRSFATALGYTQDELLALTFQQVTHPDDVAQNVDFARRAIAGEMQRYQMDKRYLHKQGHNVWMALNVVVVRDADGAPPYFLAQMQDINEHRAAAAALADSEAQFRSLSASSPVGIFRSDTQGGITYANPRVLQIFGMSEQEGLGHGWLARIHPDDVGDVTAGWAAALGAEREYAHEYRLRMDEGATQWVHCRAAPLRDASGAMVGTVGTVEDISERRLLESQLRHAQKMEAVGRLAGGVAHDFNNLLTIITGNTAFALASLPPDSQAARDLAEVDAASRRAATLTRQLLAFSRKQVLQPRRVDVNETVRSLERMLCRLIGEDVRIETALDGDAWPVHADPGQLEQVLMNLVVNARDAMPAGGVVRIRTANTSVDSISAATHPACLGAGSFLSIAVADTGVGIDAAVLPHIFEPFFTTKELGRGTGLGLAMVYGIVKQSGGTVSVESVPGEGTTFTVYLPCDSSSEGSRAAAPRAAEVGGGETVLVVEDEPAVRDVVRRMLARNGYQVVEAGDGAEALRLWRAGRALPDRAGRIDVVLADLVMPVMGGRELIERLRAEQPEVPVVLMTGYTADPAGAQADLASGEASGFLQKPLSQDSLLTQLRLVLDRDRRRRR